MYSYVIVFNKITAYPKIQVSIKSLLVAYKKPSINKIEYILFHFLFKDIKMENKTFTTKNKKIEKNNSNQDINQLKNLFSLNNYHYKDIVNDKKNVELIYRWPLLSAFNYSIKRG